MQNINAEVLIKNCDENRLILQKQDKCDKTDYLIAVACGAVGGFMDIFLVGAPGSSILGKWSDKQVDNAVMSFKKITGWNKDGTKTGNIKSAITYLENNFKVNYDQRYSSDTGDLVSGMTTRNHHMYSLAHSPDIAGLFFSVLNQFTSTSSFIDAGGHIVTLNTGSAGLAGSNIVSKLFCGIINWLGHIMSDVAGSSGAKGRGSGIVMPFYEFFGLCKFGRFDNGKNKQDLALLATSAFQEGYDFRFGLAQAVPVIVTGLLIRLVWALRQHFQFGKPVNECIPDRSHADLRVMLLFGNGTLCVMDGLDAALRSGGEILNFFMRLNLVAWGKFMLLVLKEICIRAGLEGSLQKSVAAYRRINEALVAYLNELERIDFDLFEEETRAFKKATEGFGRTNTPEELNILLYEAYGSMGIEKPWKGNFDSFMADKSKKLVFK